MLAMKRYPAQWRRIITLRSNMRSMELLHVKINCTRNADTDLLGKQMKSECILLSYNIRDQLRQIVSDPKADKLLERFRELHEHLADESNGFVDFNEAAIVSADQWSRLLYRLLQAEHLKEADCLLQVLQLKHMENKSSHLHLSLWNKLLYTYVFQSSIFGLDGTDKRFDSLIVSLLQRYGGKFVTKVIVKTVNGLIKVKQLRQASHLCETYLKAMGGDQSQQAQLPASVVGFLVTKMVHHRLHAEVDSLIYILYKVDRYRWIRFQPQAQLFYAIFKSCQVRPQKLDACMASRDAAHEYLHLFLRTLCYFREASLHSKDTNMLALFGAAIQCAVKTRNEELALDCFDEMRQWSPQLIADENIYVNVLQACKRISDAHLFWSFYQEMVDYQVARAAGFGTAIQFCRETKSFNSLTQVLDDMMRFEDDEKARSQSDKWKLPILIYNSALQCCNTVGAHDIGRELAAAMVSKGGLVPDSYTLQSLIANFKDMSVPDMFRCLQDDSNQSLDLTKHGYTSMLALCGQRQLLSEAIVVQEAMKAQNIVPDLKTYTILAYTYSVHGEREAIMDMYRSIVSAGIKTDKIFFSSILNGFQAPHGIDSCFALFQDFHKADMIIPQEMYTAMIELGTTAGCIQRTLDLAYNMECEGMRIDADKLYALGESCTMQCEAEHWIRILLLLHQGKSVETGSSHQFPRRIYELGMRLVATYAMDNVRSEMEALIMKEDVCISDDLKMTSNVLE